MTFPPNTTALDACVDLTKVHAQLAQLGFDTIIRYASKSWKGITVEEARSQQQHGLKLALVYESTARRALEGPDAGKADGAFCLAFAPTVGLQPRSGCIIYASTDFDVSAHQITAVAAYVRAFAAELPGYGVGMYANGMTNDYLYEAKIIQSRWITQSGGFTGTQDSLANGRFEIAQRLPAHVAGMDTDPNSLREPGLDIGARVPWNTSGP
jgi:hypothetical protein